MDELVTELCGVLGCLADKIKEQLNEEGLTLDTFTLLEEGDLRELGFKMGARKLLMNWIKSRGSQPNVVASPLPSNNWSSVASPFPSLIHSSSSSSPQSPHMQSSPLLSPSPSSGSQSQLVSSPPLTLPQPSTTTTMYKKVYPVEELLKNYVKDKRGAQIVQKLQMGQYYTKDERVLVMKILGKFLMKNCAVHDDPSSAEKTDMAMSIVAAFPVLHSKTTPNGYDEIYCARGSTGYLGRFIRHKRHSDPFIQTRWTWRKSGIPMADLTNFDDDERLLRGIRPNGSNISELKELMNKTRERRRAWIKANEPDATTILKRYPRLLDVTELIHDEFAAVVQNFKPLQDTWSTVRDKVLAHCETLSVTKVNIRKLLNSIPNEYDEDKKTEVSLCLLPIVLIPPPKRGRKAPCISRETASQLMFVDMNEEQMGVPEAILSLKQKLDKVSDNLAPLLFRLQGIYYVKVDAQAIPVTDAACFCDAVEFLLKCFYTFNLSYAHEIKPVYGLLEHVMGMKVSIGKSAALSDFLGIVGL